ncbi:peptidase M15 [Rhizobium deserti]|uniref:Peptidase M15 n=1 Tax=Rhizobium deserti TaxID=2547961 RepID=A0A4R5UMS6_9HYPH|nr:D-alanyl-D-alanine carboxypeptidase [Rhizobium deserti]TDK39089.1 peptidase M15 [Rhizobium deserti]
MFRFLRVAVFFLLLGFSLGVGKTEAQAGYAHFIYDATSGKVLTSENADVINHPASLTKMMTLYLTFEALHEGRLSWDGQIVMTSNAASKIPFKLGLKAGQPLTVREAVYAMAIRSANDAAAAMADHLGGSEDRFGAMMTAKARRLGMSSTVFRNASGLPDDAQVTSARDMATLAMALIRDYPEEYKLFSLRAFDFRGKRIKGHNNLMYRYPGMDGIKTGFVNASGFNIASAVNVNGHRIIGVVMGGKSARKRDDQMAALLDKYAAPNGAGSDPSGALVASVPEQKRTAEGPLPLSFAAPQKQIVVGGQPPRAAVANLYAFPSQPAHPSEAPAGQVQSGQTQPVQPQTGQTTTSAQPSDSWSIQVATAASREAASALLERARPVVSRAYAKASPSVESYAKSGKEYFRARFAGFADREAAQSACTLLKSKSVNCFVLR